MPSHPALSGEHQYVMPAEWAQHRATWIGWPHNPTDWPGKLEAVQWCYVDIVRQLATAEHVEIVFSSATAERQARHQLTAAGVDLTRITTHRVPTDRSWFRDSGGTFVQYRSGIALAQELVVVDWLFNAWAKYSDWTLDNELPSRLADIRGYRRVIPQDRSTRRPIVLEGGAVDFNGAGVALATEQCLLDAHTQPRNPGLGRAGIETALREYLGVSSVIWLGRGIAGDDTNGHVDDIARFVSPNVVVAAVESDLSDANYAPLRDNVARLEETRIDGSRLTVVPIPMPRPLRFGGQRLPASYLNFYVANGLVIVPTFNDPADRIALGQLGELFPDRNVIGIHAVDLVLGLGTLHCLTLQEPATPVIEEPRGDPEKMGP